MKKSVYLMLAIVSVYCLACDTARPQTPSQTPATVSSQGPVRPGPNVYSTIVDLTTNVKTDPEFIVDYNNGDDVPDSIARNVMDNSSVRKLNNKRYILSNYTKSIILNGKKKSVRMTDVVKDKRDDNDWQYAVVKRSKSYMYTALREDDEIDSAGVRFKRASDPGMNYVSFCKKSGTEYHVIMTFSEPIYFTNDAAVNILADDVDAKCDALSMPGISGGYDASFKCFIPDNALVAFEKGDIKFRNVNNTIQNGVDLTAITPFYLSSLKDLAGCKLLEVR